MNRTKRRAVVTRLCDKCKTEFFLLFFLSIRDKITYIGNTMYMSKKNSSRYIFICYIGEDGYSVLQNLMD